MIARARIVPGGSSRRIWDVPSVTGSAALALLVTLPASGASQTSPASELQITEVVAAALDVHPRLRLSIEEVRAAQSEHGVARAPLLPSLSLTASAVQFQEPMVVAPLHQFDPTRPPRFDESLVQGALQASYTLFDGGARGANIQAATAAVFRARANLDIARADILAAVVAAYLTVGVARSDLAAAASRVEAISAERDRAERVYTEGAAPRLEVLRAGAALEEASASEQTAWARVRAAELDLARLTGIPTEQISESRVLSIRVPATPQDARSGADTEDLSRAPRMVAARELVSAAEAQERSARAALFPTVRGLVAYQEFGSGAGDFTGEWQAGFQVSYPIFAGGARSSGMDGARARARGATAAAESVALDLRRALDQAETARVESAGRVNALRAAVVQYEEVARIEALALTEGAGVQRDLLAAEAELFRVRSQLAAAEATLVRSAVDMARIRGGLSLEWIETNLEARQ